MEEILWHENGKGQLVKCPAKIKCRLGGEHYAGATKDEAELVRENKLTEVNKALNKSLIANSNDRREKLLQDALIPLSLPAVREKDFVPFDNFNDPFDNLEAADSIEFLSTLDDGIIPKDLPESYSEVSFHHGSVMIQAHDKGYYTAVTQKSAESMAEYFKESVRGRQPLVLDPFAGRGFLVKALREQGIATIGSDNHSWLTRDSKNHQIAEYNVEKSEAVDALRKYGNDLSHLVMSWVPYESTKDHELLKIVHEEFPHIKVINIGEGAGGCTGSIEFWKHADVSNGKPFHYKSLPMVNDYPVEVTYNEEGNDYYDGWY